MIPTLNHKSNTSIFSIIFRLEMVIPSIISLELKLYDKINFAQFTIFTLLIITMMNYFQLIQNVGNY
jgi:hypothetical protein